MATKRNQSESTSGLSETRMDGLLQAFFDSEVPAKLSELPDLQGRPRLNASSTASKAPAVLSEPCPTASDRFDVNRGRRSARAIGWTVVLSLVAVAAVSLSMWSADARRNDAVVEQPNEKISTPKNLDPDATFAVSSGSDTETAIDDRNTTLNEIDQTNLAPEQK